jgi:hypothetical protein
MSMVRAFLRGKAFLAKIALLPLLPACGGGDEGAQPPVVVVQAPLDQGAAGAPASGQPAAAGYAGVSWQTGWGSGGAAGGPGTTDPNAEPYDVVALLREFDPQLVDPPNDGPAAERPQDDILSALAVMDAENVYGRVVTRAPLKPGEAGELRFWLEQQGSMVTVELKTSSRERNCELSDVKTPEQQTVVPGCFWMGNALDFRIPIKQIPPAVDTSKPCWVTGFQSCCADAERNQPYDSVAEAQEVWRMPGLASEVEAGGASDDPAPVPAAGAGGGAQ